MATKLSALALLLFTASLARAERCLDGASAVQDAADIAGVRGRIEVACPCATFDGSSSTTNRGAYAQCVRGVVDDASDGTPILGLFGLRAECRGTVKRIHRKSDCGFQPADDRNPCCMHAIGSGRNRGAVKPAARCTTSASQIRNDCVAHHFVEDACSNDATNSCTPACGDGVTNGADECDGGSDAACPGLCGTDCRCPRVVSETVTIPSGNQPAETPGSPGVVVTNPKLLAQFGGGSFSLNNATYTRYHRDRPVVTPGAILILVPGFEGGASTFAILAEDLIARALADHGLVVEVWAVDRRGHQLEDREGLDIAESFLTPLIALDWLYGAELTLTLHPALVAGPNRRAQIYTPQTDVPFMASWTNLVLSQDIDAVVTAASAAVVNDNVFLGGHSAGTGFTARYASTDFNLTGVGPADPGYAKLRGLVLIEGNGGSTGGPALTADSLDRIEARFDGGLFGAVRDNAPRCVDGTTACTVATEATDCMGQLPPKCTPPTQAYAVSAALGPRILAAIEPVGIQGINDPDTGENILRVDQGSPGNNAIAKVPGLSPLAILPAATVTGGLGSFLDDDPPSPASGDMFRFLAISIGSVGPTVGGLQTWLDITEGPLPPADLPNNGPAPTTLTPPLVWGQETEPSDLNRMMPIFFGGGTNFTDWYYPNAGPSTTSVPGVCTALVCTAGNVGAACATSADCNQSINLDSTALSVGRGRRDIENLTQAANIDIPVIAFGGSNGLVPVPGLMVPFASSIGTCTAPSCTGATPRVVDAALPNPAFPTLGDVAGGFEVHISEGYSHVDVATGSDGAGNNVIGPLADFLDRNVQ